MKIERETLAEIVLYEIIGMKKKAHQCVPLQSS